jgi:hypothetical protein
MKVKYFKCVLNFTLNANIEKLVNNIIYFDYQKLQPFKLISESSI